ncbi:glycosyltransferase family 2 protein [Rhizobiaceae bacterium n13]|uniref:Glycosyltransferase family 2 protein n=1 Tax=Ferirhizobium litorale TaxID=2927786 RepID=A0AAE3Q7X1_9HYPH|nr:glycosyltransferase [Fererhizobium litorale]MDI7860739.1 glycosyltransferase family 2 protein [Fererhizobium litorale]MDI7920887.1 glycosyltransferase family 2 protein [Fererhizobium litorale]
MISVIIPHLDQIEALECCLASLRCQTGVTQQVEIIVVDNGSKALPIEACSSIAGVTLLSEPVPGPGPARNLGVVHATGEILAFIDADCTAHSGWLAEIERCFSVDPDISILGGDVRIACRDPQRLTLLEAYESVFAYRMKEYIAKQGFTGTGNLAVRAEVFSVVGRFGGIEIAEDRDWGQRALRLGYRTSYCPGMIVYHPARKTFAELAQKWQRHTAHDFERIQSKRGWRMRWVLRSLAVAVSPIAELFRIGRSERLQGLRSRALAFVGVIFIRCYRTWIMLALALGANAPTWSARWNRA